MSIPRGWTIETYAAHNEAIREAEEKFQTERDRRYAEVKNAEEKALKVKEEADKAALGLAREIQTYKDEKANELREQINSERGLYATKADVAAAVDKIEATLKPVFDYISADRAQRLGIQGGWGYAVGVVGLLLALGSLIMIGIKFVMETPR